MSFVEACHMINFKLLAGLGIAISLDSFCITTDYNDIHI